MSVLQQAMVWRLKLPHNQAWVLMALADHAHDDGSRCFPGVGQLAWKTGYGARQVRRILHDLREDGIIEAVAFVHGGRGRATEYTLYLTRGIMKASYVADRGDPVKDDILTLALGGKADISDTKGDIPGQNPDTTGQKDDTAIAAQPSITINEPSGEPSIYAAWLTKLRGIDGWDAKGEPHLGTLLVWIGEKGWTDQQLEDSAIGLAATSAKTLKGYKDMASAYQRRLSQGYDDPTRQQNGITRRGVGAVPHEPAGEAGGTRSPWDNRG